MTRIDLPWTKPPLILASFAVTGEPATKGRARFSTKGGKVRAYTPADVVRAEAAITAAYLQIAKRRSTDKLTLFGVVATFYTATGQRRDVDNMLKLVLDGLNKIAWADDSQVSEVFGRKVMVPKGEARTEVAIYQTGEMASREAACQECGATFPLPPSHAGKKFCSQACRSASLTKRRTRTCPRCGDKFSHAHPGHAQTHCSAECAYAAKHVEVTCVRCGNGFTKARSSLRSGNHYCSDECKANYWRDHRKSAAKGTCQDCGGPTTKKTYMRCRDCSYAAGGRHAYGIRDAGVIPDDDTAHLSHREPVIHAPVKGQRGRLWLELEERP